MSGAPSRYPLAWPAGRPRTKARRNGQFKAKRPWREVIGYPEGAAASKVAIRAHFRARALVLHPDQGGDDRAMAELNVALEEALREAGDA